MPTTGPIPKLSFEERQTPSRNSAGAPTLPPRFGNGSPATAPATGLFLSRTAFVGSDSQIAISVTKISGRERTSPGKADPDRSPFSEVASSHVRHYQPAINVVQVVIAGLDLPGRASAHSVDVARKPVRRDLRLCVLETRGRPR